VGTVAANSTEVGCDAFPLFLARIYDHLTLRMDKILEGLLLLCFVMNRKSIRDLILGVGVGVFFCGFFFCFVLGFLLWGGVFFFCLGGWGGGVFFLVLGWGLVFFLGGGVGFFFCGGWGYCFSLREALLISCLQVNRG